MPIRAVTFDVYSALFDSLTGLAEALAAFVSGRGLRFDAVALARVWRQKQREYLLVANSLEAEPASNRRAIVAAARYALRDVAADLSDPETAALTAAWERLPPWPETVEVLQEVRRRPVVLAALSNGDEGALRALLATLPVPLDPVISTEGGRFKPHSTAYARALRALGLPADAVLHVAGSPTDAMGATLAGIPTLWVNRHRDAVLDPRFAPRYEAPDLTAVVRLLGT